MRKAHSRGEDHAVSPRLPSPPLPARIWRARGLKPRGQLPADAEIGDDLAVPLDALDAEVVEQATPLTDQLEQAAPGVMILGVQLEVFGEIRDTLGQKSNLNLGRAGVAV